MAQSYKKVSTSTRTLDGFLGNEDHLRVFFANDNIFPFKLLVCFMCQSEEDVNKAMYTDELRRATGLADQNNTSFKELTRAKN